MIERYWLPKADRVCRKCSRLSIVLRYPVLPAAAICQQPVLHSYIKQQGQNLFCRNGTDLIGLPSDILRKIIKSVLKKKNFLANVGFFD